MIRDFFLGFVKIHILHHAAQEEIYGVAMIQELHRHGYDMSPGTMYPILHGLERDGYLAREDRVVNGKVRKYYGITGDGRAALVEARAKMVELAGEVLEGRGPSTLPDPDDSDGQERAILTREEKADVDDLISVDTFMAHRTRVRNPVVIDVRGDDEYRQSHLPGALHLPEDQLRDRMAELPQGRPLVTYCTMRHRGDSRSERAAALLRESGFDAQALDGGLPAWEAAGSPVEHD